MKNEFLRSLNLDEDIIKQIQAESGKDVTSAKASMQATIDSLNGQISELTGQITQRDENFAELQKQLEAVGQSSAKMKEVQAKFDELNNKYATETENYKKQLADQQYKFDVTQMMSDVKFSSKAAQRDCLNDLMNNRLPIQDGKIVGFNEYISKRKEAEPDSFLPEKSENKPTFAPPSNPETVQQKSGNSFGFNFQSVHR